MSHVAEKIGKFYTMEREALRLSHQRAIEAAEKKERKYPALRVIEWVLRIVGYLMMIASVVSIVKLLLAGEALDVIISGYSSTTSLLAALMLIVFSELIQVFIDIEYNTRRTYVDQYYLYHHEKDVASTGAEPPAL